MRVKVYEEHPGERISFFCEMEIPPNLFPSEGSKISCKKFVEIGGCTHSETISLRFLRTDYFTIPLQGIKDIPQTPNNSGDVPLTFITIVGTRLDYSSESVERRNLVHYAAKDKVATLNATNSNENVSYDFRMAKGYRYFHEDDFLSIHAVIYRKESFYEPEEGDLDFPDDASECDPDEISDFINNKEKVTDILTVRQHEILKEDGKLIVEAIAERIEE